MINCFYLYAVVWSGILLLYSLNLSEYSQPLSIDVYIFLIVTILISIIIGTCLRKKFFFKRVKTSDKKVNKLSVVFLTILFLLNVIYMKDIPLFTLGKKESYGSMSGLPFFLVLLYIYGIFFALKNIYYFLCSNFKRKEFFIAFLFVEIIFLLLFSRSQLLISILGAGFILLSYLESENKIKIKYVILTFALLAIGLYFFGVLGNIRCGYKPLDCSFITILGRIKKWPGFIPKSYQWAYTYAITPLSNLDLNIRSVKPINNFIALISELFPETFTKRLIGNQMIIKTAQHYSVLTATSAFTNAYVTFGIMGAYIVYICLCMNVFIGLWWNTKVNDEQFSTLFFSYMTVIFVFTVFENPLKFTATALVIYIIFLSSIVNNFVGKKNIKFIYK